ncbi:MAG: hypothetical protein ACYC2H_08410 [Thermoplasmatota archaeon]
MPLKPSKSDPAQAGPAARRVLPVALVALFLLLPLSPASAALPADPCQGLDALGLVRNDLCDDVGVPDPCALLVPTARIETGCGDIGDVPDPCAVVASLMSSTKAATDCLPDIGEAPDPCTYVDAAFAALDGVSSTLMSAANARALVDACGFDPMQCLPPLALATSASMLGKTVTDLELMRSLLVKTVAGGLPDLTVEDPTPQAAVLGELLAAQAASGGDASVLQLLLDATGAQSLEQIPSDVLALAAATAPPAGARTAYFEEGLGQQWYDLLTIRFLALTDEISTAVAAGGMAFEGPGEFPVESTLQATDGLRQERALVGAALLFIGFYQANSNGNLAHSLGFLGQVAMVSEFDLSLVLERGAMSGTAATSAGSCGPVQELYAQLFQLANQLVALVEDAGPLVDETAAWLVALLNGEWYDTFVTVANLIDDTAVPNSLGAADPLIQSVQHGTSAPQAVYQGAYVLQGELIGQVVRDLAPNQAHTDAGGKGDWSVAIMRTLTSATDHSWEVPGVNMKMDQGVLQQIENTPVVFDEEGVISQDTSQDGGVIVLVEEQKPGWTYTGEYSSWRCYGKTMAYKAAIAGGVLAIAFGGPVGIAGGVIAIAGATAGFAADDPECAQQFTYDEGFYHETGVYTNYWGDFDWAGQGMLLGGLVGIYGTATQVADAQAVHTTPWDNAGSIRGHGFGKQSAASERAKAAGIADGLLAEFRPAESLAGDAHITIEILCAAYESLAVDFEANLPIDSGTSICLKVEIGGSSTGWLSSPIPGYGTIEMGAHGVASGGYVKVNGNTVPSPGVIDLDAKGVNIN